MRLPPSALLPLLLAPLLATAPALAAPAQDASNPVTGLPAQDSVVDAIFAAEELQVMEHLATLSEGIGPRLTSSNNLTRASEWAADRFRSWGLHNVRLEEWGTFPVGFNRLGSRGDMIKPRHEPLVFTTRAWAAGTQGPSRGVVKIGPRNAEEMEAAKGSLAGCWVLTTARPRFGSDEDNLRSQLGNFYDDEDILGLIRAGRGELVHTGGNYRIDAENLPTRVDITLLAKQWQEMHALAEAGEEVVVEFDIDVEFVPGPIPLYNVIAEIPGETDELIIIGGHLDSWDGALGTQDNGTGTCTTLEAARLLGSLTEGKKPKRTIRFMLWSGEEQGLLGSRAYIRQHPEEMDRISCVLVHDGGTNACVGIHSTPGMKPMFEEIFAPIIEYTHQMEDSDLHFRINEVERLPRGIGSDHDSYLAASNPAPGYFWQQRGKTSYGFIHHTQNDVYRYARADYEEYTSRVVASAAWRFANAKTMVPRDDMMGGGPPPAPRKRMGVRLAEDGYTVSAVTPESLAAQAGIKVGDVMLKVGDVAIKDRNALRQAIREVGDQADVVVRRGDQEMTYRFDWKAGKAAPAGR